MGLVVGAIGMTGTLILIIAGIFIAALLVVLLTAVVLAVFVIRWGEMDAGRTIAARVLDRMDHDRRRVRRESMYVTGLFSALPDEALTALPGALSDVDEIDGVDGAGQPYTLLHHKQAKTIAATFVCAPDGTALQPQDLIDSQVSRFGSWIASLSKDNAVVGGMVVVDSALSYSSPLVAKIRSEVSSSAPAVAQQALLEAASLMPGSVSMVDAYASVWPATSSITWAVMCRAERVTTSRGRSGAPKIFLRPRT